MMKWLFGAYEKVAKTVEFRAIGQCTGCLIPPDLSDESFIKPQGLQNDSFKDEDVLDQDVSGDEDDDWATSDDGVINAG